MFSKVLVANRGEIAVRAFRAAVELGARTVAVFPYEDRNAVHRIKADESYLIGERGHPVRAYLDVDEIVRVARECGADAVYPGYGFLSENPRLAEACEAAGIAFVGPPPGVLSLAGNKVRALAAAREAGIPVLRSSAPSSDVEELLAAAEDVGFPIFVKAVAGGGGRGMRRVEQPGGLQEALETAMREAEGAFGDPTVFLEQAVARPAAHRGAGAGRRHGGDAAPVRARLLGAAAAPEGGRDRAGARPRPRAARRALPRRRRLRPCPRLRQRRHRRVPGGDRR